MKPIKILKLYNTKQKMNLAFKELSVQLGGVSTIRKSNKIIYIGKTQYFFTCVDQLHKYEFHNFNRVQVEERLPSGAVDFICRRVVNQ